MQTRSRKAFTLLEIMIVVAIIGILAAVAVQSFGKSIGKAQQQACALNRRNIDGAKLQWATETRQPLTATPRNEDLFGEDAYIEHKPECPASGVYSLNEVREKCTCSAAKHVN